MKRQLACLPGNTERLDNSRSAVESNARVVTLLVSPHSDTGCVAVIHMPVTAVEQDQARVVQFPNLR